MVPCPLLKKIYSRHLEFSVINAIQLIKSTISLFFGCENKSVTLSLSTYI